LPATMVNRRRTANTDRGSPRDTACRARQ
jgi:hypothetical protein